MSLALIFLRRHGLFILGGFAIIAIIVWVDHRGYARAAETYQARIDKLQTDIAIQTAALREKRQAEIDAEAGTFEKFRRAIEPLRAESRNTIKEVYRDVPVPSDCDLLPAAAGVLEAARLRANAAAAGQFGEPLRVTGGTDPAAGP